jgi:hypothetical protein
MHVNNKSNNIIHVDVITYFRVINWSFIDSSPESTSQFINLPEFAYFNISLLINCLQFIHQMGDTSVASLRSNHLSY